MGLCLRGVCLHWPISSPSIYATHTNIHTYTGLRHRSVLTTSTCSIYPFGPTTTNVKPDDQTNVKPNEQKNLFFFFFFFFLISNQMTRKHLFILKVLRIRIVVLRIHIVALNMQNRVSESVLKATNTYSGIKHAKSRQ
jgi:hypothetical protein